jgi:hypothetical protein
MTSFCHEGCLMKHAKAKPMLTSTSLKRLGGKAVRYAEISSGLFAGEPYANLFIVENPEAETAKENIIGLRFLARHLVTLNIPKGVLYLQRGRSGPLDE